MGTSLYPSSGHALTHAVGMEWVNLRTLSERAFLLASDKTWIEDEAIRQLHEAADREGMIRVVGMPDLHPGKGGPVGATFLSKAIVYPTLVGNDIGCGMALWQTDIKESGVSLDKLEKKLGSLDGEAGSEWLENNAPSCGLPGTAFDRSLGTIGGGNHFAELQKVEIICDAQRADALGLDRKTLLLLVHSGSRGLGQDILCRHAETCGAAGLVASSPEGAAYRRAHDQAMRYAALNRRLIALRFLEQLRAEGKALLDRPHNFVAPVRIGNEDGWLHRKGAVPADEGLVVIPGSRGDYSWLVAPVPTEGCLLSLAHGAGRKWKRADCKGRLASRYRREQLMRTRLGSRVVCDDARLLYEEAPEAYKPVDSIIESMQQDGLVSLVARLKPVLTYKTRKEEGQ